MTFQHDIPPAEGFDADLSTLVLHPETLRVAAYIAFICMVLVSTAVTLTSIDVDWERTPLYLTYGYNNVCIMWDFSPAKEIAAMIFPVAEYLLQGHLVVALIRSNQTTLKGITPKWYFVMTSVFTSVAMFLIAQVRIIFVVPPTVDVGLHTLPFIGLQVALMLIAVQNYIFNHLIGGHMFDKSFLRPIGASIVAIAYVVIFFAVTLTKIVIVASILGGAPAVNVKQPSGARFAQAVDTLWFVFAVAIPMLIAIVQRRNTPPMVLSLRPKDNSMNTQPA
mmetsp:Transcript_23277/g.63078  ORF Transcript_23277/g.63078 Transcript_23277/m.63078 type:complete len:278 (-) Transcript_23277:349-1182(-)